MRPERVGDRGARTRSRRRARPTARRAGRRPGPRSPTARSALMRPPPSRTSRRRTRSRRRARCRAARATSARTGSTRRRTSVAVPFWSLTMKLACFSDTTAPPIRRPLSPAASISRPAESPGGLRKTLPADGMPSGWCAWRQRRISSRRPLIVVGVGGREPEGRVDDELAGLTRLGVLEPAVAVGERELRGRHDRLGPGRVEDARGLEDRGDIRLVGAGVGPHGTADRARDRRARTRGRSGRPAASRSPPGPSARRRRRCSARRRPCEPSARSWMTRPRMPASLMTTSLPRPRTRCGMPARAREADERPQLEGVVDRRRTGRPGRRRASS